MDHTVSNISELEKALSKLTQNENSHEHIDQSVPSTSSKDESTRSQALPSTNLRHQPPSTQYSSNSLLQNSNGLQTETNRKLDYLADCVLRLTQAVNGITKEQEKHTELLATIARNCISSTGQHFPISRRVSDIKGTDMKLKDYNFINGEGIVCELIIKILKQVELQAMTRGCRYRSTRVMEKNMMRSAVEVACKTGFKVSPGVSKEPIKLPANKEPMILHIAGRVGEVNGIMPVLNSEALRDLFSDTNCSSFMSIVEEVIERLKIIRIMIPFYEADLVNAISFPYFDSNGSAICNWNLIIPRNETAEEAEVIGASVTNRKKIGTMIASGIKTKAAINSTIKMK